MKVLAVVFLAFGALPSACISAKGSSGVTPVQKVVQLLSEMVAKGKEAKHVEEVEFAKFQEWCTDTRAETTKNIEEETAQIKQLTADIQIAKSDAENLGLEIGDLEATILTEKKEVKNATEIREKEHADYMVQHTDFSESIDACKKAIQVLKARSADVPQSLLQVQKSPLLPADAKAMVTSLISMTDTANEAIGAPEANAYEFQSGSVIAILEKLAARFSEELLALQKAEMSAKANYEVLMQQLTDNIKEEKSSVAKKTELKACRMGDAAKASGDLVIVQEAKLEDETTLSDTTAECHQQSGLFEKNQVTRAEEIASIQKALKILTSPAVTGHAETYLPGAALVQVKKTAFALLRKEVSNPDARSRAAAYLQANSQRLGSHYLLVMAEHVTADPFAKVKKMIKDLIVKLMEQANEEADQHAYCTSELATNKQTRDNKGAEVEDLTAKADQLTAEAAQLAAEITDLSDSIKEIKGQQAKATALRAEEKATNEKTVSDAKEAQTAVEQAIQVLRTFYSKDSEAALAQTSKQPLTEYKGMGGESTGVLGMLDVILSDFTRLETQTMGAEDQAVASYEKYMAESTQDAEVKETEMKHNEDKKQKTEETLHNTKKELELTQKELDAALDYYQKLKEECLDTGLSYEARVKRREEEIQSLQEALKILNGEDLA